MSRVLLPCWSRSSTACCCPWSPLRSSRVDPGCRAFVTVKPSELLPPRRREEPNRVAGDPDVVLPPIVRPARAIAAEVKAALLDLRVVPPADVAPAAVARDYAALLLAALVRGERRASLRAVPPPARRDVRSYRIEPRPASRTRAYALVRLRVDAVRLVVALPRAKLPVAVS